MTQPRGARSGKVAWHPGAAGAGATAGGDLVVGVLGPLELSMDGRPMVVRTGRLRALLVVLAMSADRTITVDQLAAAIWGEQPPANARRSVQTYVTRLRGVLGAGAIATRPAGYALALEPDRVDALRFLRLLDAAGQESEPATKRARLAEALGLWRGTPFSDVPSMRLTELESARLVERFLLALEQRIDLDMAEGLHPELVAELTELTDRHPLRESLWVRLLLVLDRCGRPAEALTRYETIRARLAEELGVDPSPELREVFADLLAGRRPAPAGSSISPPDDDAGPPKPARARAVPQQLPADLVAFAGRRDKLRQLDAMLPNVRGPRRTATVITIHGTAGVGKTALAVHWAHLVRDQFPDGQLYVDLRGRARTPPARPIEVLAGFLRALGEPAERVPTATDEAAALYRTLLADRQVLVVLDNAHRVEQLRPLLPASTGCLALVTSQDRLSGLVAREGAYRVALDVLTEREAVVLLARALPLDRVRAEPRALAGLARACAYLPLALRIASANLADRPAQRIAEHVSELTEGNRLGALQVERDEHSAVRAAFNLSYNALDPEARRMFRRLGLLVGHDITPAAAAALADTTTAQAQRLLERLAAAALIVERSQRRYGFHDLLQLYAAERVQHDHRTERDAARGRYFQWWLRSVDAAARLVYPDLPRLPLPEPDAGASLPLEGFRDPAQALAWLDAERANLVAVVEHTANQGPRAVAWRLADALRGYFWRRMSPIDWPIVAEAGLRAANAEGDLRGRAACHLNLANLHGRRSQYGQAVAQLEEARRLCDASGWLEGQASTLGALSTVYWMMGELREAADHGRQALDLSQRIRWVAGQSSNLGRLGMVCWTMGRLREAAEYHQQALALDRKIGNRVNESHALGNLGETYHALGRLADALGHLDEALELRQRLGDRGGQGEAYNALAALHRDRGDLSLAFQCGTTALAIARDTGERRLEGDVLNTLGTIYSRRANHPAALEHHRQALDLARGTSTTPTEVLARIGLASAHQQLGERDDALDCAEQALTLARSAGYRMTEGQALTTCAEVYHAQGRHADAKARSRQALEIHHETGHRPGVARTLLVLADVIEASGVPNAALSHRRRARFLLAEIGMPDTETARNPT
jgi:DNA-binding SARP family transcriptional activator/Tfp pilus assembly protein PilF